MTTFQAAVQAVLEPLVPGGAWYEENPTEPLATGGDGGVLPYIVWSVVVGIDNLSLEGPSTLKGIQVQVDIYAPLASVAAELRMSVDAAFAASSLNAIPLSWHAFNEEAVKLRRISRDFNIWYDES